MRLIDAGALKYDLIHNRSFFPSIVKHAIDAAPTVNAVDVVRCHECKWHNKKECPLIFETDEWVDDIGGHPARIGADHSCWNGFCHKGERKEA